jgi:hypothetical protein
MTETEKLEKQYIALIESKNLMINKRLSIVTNFIQKSNFYIVEQPEIGQLLEVNNFLLLEINTDSLFQRFKINLLFEISIRLEDPKQIDFMQQFACYDTLRRIIERLECEGIKHHLFYKGIWGDDYDYFNYCVKLNDEVCSKNDFFEAISDLLAFKIFESLFSFPDTIFSPTDEEIDNHILKFWRIKQAYLDILCNPIYKSSEYDEDNF